MIGRIHSFQSLGTVDGPGVRFVVFLQGCNLRCKCCHNPDTWEMKGGKEYTPEQVLEKALRFREYFGQNGGITLSGGEPLLQSEFAYELFSLCKKENINTCIDTSGSIINASVRRLTSVLDYALLDIKYTSDALYKENAGCSLSSALKFLALLDENGIKTTIRQVIIPTVNDTEENVLKLKAIAASHKCVVKAELLPFKKICQSKYDNMGIVFPFADIDEPSRTKMEQLNSLLI